MPGTKNREEIVIAPEGAIFYAEVGTPAPDDSTEALDDGWVELGYATEDGVTLGVGRDINDIRGWQAFDPLRRVVTGRTITAAFALLQLNRDSVVLAFGGEVTEPSPGEYRYEIPDAAALEEKALLVEWEDGDKHYRVVFPRGNVSENVDVQLVRNDAASVPITFTALGADDDSATMVWLTDDPAFEPAGSS